MLGIIARCYPARKRLRYLGNHGGRSLAGRRSRSVPGGAILKPRIALAVGAPTANAWLLRAGERSQRSRSAIAEPVTALFYASHRMLSSDAGEILPTLALIAPVHARRFDTAAFDARGLKALA